jgi:DNA-binding NtrC family response regulator
LDALQAYGWPGNVRELRHCIERAVILAKGPLIELDELPRRVADGNARAIASSGPKPREWMKARNARVRDREVDVDALMAALDEAHGNRSRAAIALGLTRNQIRYRLRKIGIE